MPTPVVSPSAPPLARLDRVELAKAGTWAVQVGGTQAFTGDDFAAAVAALECPAIRRPVVKIGHLDPRGSGLTSPGLEGDGEPALGWVANMGLANDRQALVADLVGMPGWLGQIAASAFPDRSIEGARNYRCALGHVHPFVVSAVALLGVTPPGVATLGSLQDHVRALYGVAAASNTEAPGGEPFAVTFTSKEAPVPNPRPELVAAAVTVDELRTAFHTSAPWDYWITEIQLDPLQLIVTSDSNGETYRVPVTIGADGDSFSFGAPVAVEVTYVDTDESTETVAAGAKPLAEKPLSVVFASRAQSRPGDKPPPPAQPAEPVAAADSPAAEPDPTTKSEEDDVSDLSDIARRLGLPEDAAKEQILAALDERATGQPTAAQPTEPTPQQPTPTQPTEPTLPLPAEPAPTPQQSTAPQPDLVAAAAAHARRDQEFAAAVGEIKNLSEELAKIKAEKAAQVKTAFFAAAVQAGRIRPADRKSWETRYDKAPELVTEIIGAMAAGSAVPVAVAGYVGDPEPDGDSDLEAAIARLDGPYAKKETVA